MIAKKQSDEAKAKRKGKKAPPVAAYPPKPPKKSKGGRGKKGMKLA